MPREYCKQCERPISECYCEAIVSLDNSIPVLILQHPSESKHPYNTARIVKRCLKHCTVIQSELIPPETMQLLASRNTVLLFPELPWLPAANPLPHPIELLVVIDGTWKKAKKILHLNPALQTLPRMSLTGIYQSRYQIRKGSLREGLSTIESVAEALNQLEPDQNYDQLLTPFERMISLAQRYHPD